jgi:formate dehydrogenase major subunit
VDIDKHSKLRKSQDNPDVLKLYKDYFGEPNSHLAHELLHTHYHHVDGDSLGSNVLKKSNSAFFTREFEICVCDKCAALGSKELYENSLNKIRAANMNHFVEIRSIRMKETHDGEGIYVTLDGNRISADQMSNIYQTLKSIRKA